MLGSAVRESLSQSWIVPPLAAASWPSGPMASAVNSPLVSIWPSDRPSSVDQRLMVDFLGRAVATVLPSEEIAASGKGGGPGDGGLGMSTFSGVRFAIGWS